MPLVETLWADGRNDYEQLRLLYDFAIKHVANLARATDGMVDLSDSDINRFLDRFAHERPPQALVKELRQIAVSRVLDRSDTEAACQQCETVIEYCLEIAAATVSDDFDGVPRRFVKSERDLLLELLDSLRIPADRVWSV